MGPGRFWQLLTKPYTSQITTVEDGTSQVFDARGFWKLSVMAPSGATVTIHRVDSYKASVVGTPGTGTERDVTGPSAGETLAIEVDWPFYHVSASGADVEVALI